MTNHYYSSSPQVASKPQTWTYQLLGHRFSFQSDAGVFSKDGVDFGSRLLIESYTIPETLQSAGLLDMGCGYGPIGLAYAKAYPNLAVTMVDVNERAVDLAKANQASNHISNAHIQTSYLYDDLEGQRFGVIVSNPPIRAGKDVVHTILEQAYDHLVEGGQLVIVIQKKQGAPSAQKKMEEVFGNCQRIAWDKGYWILTSEKE